MIKRFSPSYLVILFVSLFAISTHAQSPYTSVQSGPWNDDNTWSGTGIPVAGNTATIANTHNVTVSAAAAACGTLNINAGGTLTLQAFAITVTGTTTVNGTVTTAVGNAGTKSFGIVTVGATGQWNLSGQNPATSFGGNITNGGTFNNGTGAVTIASSLSLLGANAMTFGGIVTVGATITLTNSNTNTVTLSNTGVALGGTGTFTQGTTTNTLSYAGSSVGVTTFNTTGANNTVNYSGGTQAIRDQNYVNLATSGTLTKTWTTAAGRTVTGALTVGAGSTIAAVNNNTIQVNGLTTVNGTLNLGGTGLKTFGGGVDVNTGGVWDLTSAVQPTSFTGGITNDGTFDNGTGAVTIAATQSLLGGGAMTFGGVLTMGGGVVLTNSNTNTVTLSNTGSALAGPGGFAQGTTGNTLSYAGSSIGVSAFVATGANNTVIYSGGTQAIRDVAYVNLSTTGTLTKTWTFGANRLVTGALSVGTGTTLATVNNNTLGINGTTSIDGTINLGGTGTKTFSGAVSVNTGGVWDLSGAVQPTSFGGGITMSGTTFNNGTGAAAFSATQSLAGANDMTFGGTITPAAATTLTNSNTGTVTVSSTGSIVLTGNFSQGTNANLSLAAAAPVSGAGTFNASVNANNVTYTGASPAIKAATYHNLIVNGSGTATVGGATVVNGTMTVTSAVTNNSTLTVTTALSGANTLTQGASSTLNIGGTSGITGLTATAASNTVNYTGTAQTIKTPTTSTYRTLGLSGSGNKTFGAALTISVNLSITGAVANLGTFTHTAGTLTLAGTGQSNGSWGSTGSTATNKSDTYFLSTASGIVNVSTCTVTPPVGTAITYYSRNATSGGNWDDNNSWTTSSDGTGGPLAGGVWPRVYDNVVIRSGHTIVVNAITDNSYCGISPDALGDAEIGAGGGTGFNGSNTAMFYQTGDIAISGTLSVTTGVNVMLAGYTRIASTGAFTLPSYLVNAGYLEADASSTLTTLDDLSLTGTSTTIINTTATSADDLNIDHTSATLCGTGTQGLLNSGGSAINYTNSASVSQICTSFTVTCSGGGCSGFPVVGTSTVILGNTGPGGIDKRDGTGSLEIWLDSYDVNGNGTNPANGAAIVTWTDKSGNGVNVTRNITTPTVATYSTAPGIVFAGNGYLLGSDATFPAGGTARTAYVCASTPLTADDDNLFFYGNDAGSQSFGIMKTAAERVRNFFYGNDLDDTGGTAGWLPANQTKVVNTRYASNFQEIFVDGTAYGTKAATPNTVLGDGVQIGGWSAFPVTNSVATIKEVLLYSKAINNAHRVILDNYLAAKYNTSLTANDLYTMDDSGNGNYDYEVAGIGQASDGSYHKDARGTGIVRMWNPNGLADGEFLLWGHDNATLVSSTTTVGLAGVDGAVIKERLVRKWRVGEINGDVGTVSISFDLSSFPSSMGSNLRLLIDRDGDGFGDNDVTPISGTLISGTIVFSGVNFQSGDRFTLGNADLATPLPIELVSFYATPQSNHVILNWTTASELNNDFFTVERSSGGEVFSSVGSVHGKGTTNRESKYSLTDFAPISGTAYYRLKQTDFDGTFTYSKIIAVDYDGASIPVMEVFPNPSAGHQLNIKISGLKNMESVPVVMYDQMGRECMRLLLNVDKNSGTATKTFPPEVKLTQGMYILKAGNSQTLTVRFLVSDK